MAAGGSGILLHEALEVDGRPFLVCLTPAAVFWESCPRGARSPTSTPPENAFLKDRQLIDLKEVIGVQAEKYEGNEGFSTKDSCAHLCVELENFNPKMFSVYCLRCVGHHKWRERKVTFRCRESITCQMWVNRIQELLQTEFNRPKKLLIFINPFGGKKKGPKIYAEKIAPLFKLAGILTDVTVTLQANHAFELLQEYDLGKCDGIVVVGGDGMFNEVLNGLLTRTMRDAGIPLTSDEEPISPNFKIGIIPAGSTDTVVYSTVGINDPVTSALHIIIGDTLAVDVCSIHQAGNLVRYSVSMVGYGYYGDVLADSERLRWMGPKRYDWSGFKKFLANRSYGGEVSFTVSTDTESHPEDNTRCLANCMVCSAARERKAKSSEKMLQNSGECRHIRGDFIGINAVTMSCQCALSPEGVSPSSHLGDGCTDLILVMKCSRLDYFRHLYRCMDRQSNQFDFNFVQVFRVKEFRFRPLSEDQDDDSSTGSGFYRLRRSSRASHTSVWNCDGEVIEHPSVHVKVHCQLVKLFARGIEDSGKRRIQCPGSCLKCQEI